MTLKPNLVELIRYQGGLALVEHYPETPTRLAQSRRVAHYYADLASRRAAVAEGKARAKKYGCPFQENT